MLPEEKASIPNNVKILKDRQANETDKVAWRTVEDSVLERALTPVSQSTMNGLNIYVPRGSSTTISKQQHGTSIYNVAEAPPFDDNLASPGRCGAPPQYPPPSIPRQQHHVHNHIPTSYPATNYSYSPPTRKITASQTLGSLSRNISSEFGPTTRSLSSNNLHHTGGLSSVSSSPPMSTSPSMSYHDPQQQDTSFRHITVGENGPAITGHDHLAATNTLQRDNSTNSVVNGHGQMTPQLQGASPPSGNGTSGWSSAIGRANLGKSGRVIERLMGDNDMLKRDVQIERLRAEESKQAVKMVEGRMDAMVGDYESKLHDAAVNKTLLKRRERQVQDLKAQVEGEKRKAEKAEEQEEIWRQQVDRVRQEWEDKAERAIERERLMDGRATVMASHWSDTKREVVDELDSMRTDIADFERRRRTDEEKFERLENVCRQQEQLLDKMQREKDAILERFEEYKRIETEALREIKDEAHQRELAQEKTLRETHRVLGELRWAMQMKEDLRGEK